MNSQRVQLKLVLPVKWFMDGTNMNEWLCWSFCLLDLKANEGWCKGIFTFLLQVNSTSFTCKCNWLVIKTYEVNPVCFSPWILISLRGALSNAVHSNHIIELCSVCRCEQHTLQLSSAAILWAQLALQSPTVRRRHLRTGPHSGESYQLPSSTTQTTSKPSVSFGGQTIISLQLSKIQQWPRPLF